MTWMERKRIPMKEGTEFIVGGVKVRIDDTEKQVSGGSSCLVYHGHIISENGMIPNGVIIKEFYPDMKKKNDVIFDIVRDRESGRLLVSGTTKEKEQYKMAWEQFMQGLDYQKKLAASGAMEIAVKPMISGEFGDSYYIISDAHLGSDLKQVEPVTLKEKLGVAVNLVETMAILHQEGYIMLDFKPENFLWIRKPNLIKIVDTDSLVSYRNRSWMEGQRLYINSEYISPQIQMLEKYLEDGVSNWEFERMKKANLKPISDLYAIGKYLYHLFFHETWRGGILSEQKQEEMLDSFLKYYMISIEETKLKVKDTGKALLGVLNKLLIEDMFDRMEKGYRDAEELLEDLSSIYLGFTSQKYIPKKQIARANGTFAAYNMLEKYPLFSFAQTKDGVRQLKAVLAGNHRMRKDMLSAIISIGQMTDSELTVTIAASDGKSFWEDYISKEKNEALKEAVTWSVDGTPAGGQINKKLVDRSLGHINIINDMSEKVLEQLIKNGNHYFVFLSEEEEENKEWLGWLENALEADGSNVFAAYLYEEEIISRQKRIESMQICPISVSCYSEHYSEQMFEERIFDMGLMVHAYYCECLDKIDSVNLNEFKADFCKNIYNVESSERCALHAMYKMACVGLYGNIPRKHQRYEEILKDARVLEELSWIEHLSWTAYLLTTGARPISLEQFDSYAYKGDNDWKDRTDSAHMKHPLLVSSVNCLSEADWKKETDYDMLDELDKVSFGIWKWYIDHKEMFHNKTAEILCQWNTDSMEEKRLKDEMVEIITKCINGIGHEAMNQDKTDVMKWKGIVKKAESFSKNKMELKEIINSLGIVMKPVVDSYNDRDYKELDRRMVHAAASIVG